MKLWNMLAIAAVVVVSAGAAHAQVVGPIQFTEPEFPMGTTIDGLTVNTLNGAPIPPLSFTFSVGGSPSTDCTVAGGPGTTTYVSDPSIEGAPGTLTIDLGGDVGDFRFGFAVVAGEGGGEGARRAGSPWASQSAARTLRVAGVGPLAVPGAVLLTGYTSGGASVGSVVVDALDLPGDDFPGNLAVLTSVTPFRRVVIEWNPFAVGRFALDDLTVRQAVGETAVPVLSGTGMAALAAAILAAGIAALRSRV